MDASAEICVNRHGLSRVISAELRHPFLQSLTSSTLRFMYKLQTWL